jgi:hypothetical protein
MSKPLPVTDLLNNVITVNNYLRASQSIKLAPYILDNPAYDNLVQNFNNWQHAIWSEYFEGLIDDNLTAQPQEIAKLYDINAVTQGEINGILFPSGGSVPGVVSLCDDVSSLIGQGEQIVIQLQGIANTIQGADQKLVDTLQNIADALQGEFNEQEDELTDDAINSAIDIVACVINVSVAVGTEGDAIQPLIKGITKVATDVITELEITDSINNLLNELESTWELLDQASMDLAQINMTLNQLNTVVEESSTALTSLDAIVTDWTKVADTSTESHKRWIDTGKDAMDEWSSRMIKVAFTTASQSVSASVTT